MAEIKFLQDNNLILLDGELNSSKLVSFAKEKQPFFVKEIQKIDFNGYLEQGYVCHIKPLSTEALTTFFMKKEDTISGILKIGGREETFFIHKYYRGRYKTLQDIYGVIELQKGDDKILTTIFSEDVAKTVDTNLFMFKDLAFKDVDGQYHEKNEGLVYIDSLSAWVKKTDVVVTADTEEQLLKRQCQRYVDEAGVESFYRYREMMPNHNGGRAFFFNELDFSSLPKKRKIGVELEFASAVIMSKKAFMNKEIRKNWACVRDGSIPESGAEFVSLPLLPEQVEDNVNQLYKLGVDSKFTVDKSCGFHFHVSADDLGFVEITNLVNICKSIEEDIMKMVPPSRHKHPKARPLDELFDGFFSNKTEISALTTFYGSAETAKTRHEERTKYKDQRYYWLNIDRFYHKRNSPKEQTVEFRIFEASLNPKRVLAYALLSYSIVEFAKNNSSSVCKSVKLADIVKASEYNEIITKNL